MLSAWGHASVDSRFSAASGARHLRTTCGALLAGAHTFIHVTNGLATRGTSFADVRTYRANFIMQVRVAEHKVRGCFADIRAINHEPKMIRLNMGAPRSK